MLTIGAGLKLKQARIAPLLCHQLFVIALLEYCAMLHNGNRIRLSDSREAV